LGTEESQISHEEIMARSVHIALPEAHQLDEEPHLTQLLDEEPMPSAFMDESPSRSFSSTSPNHQVPQPRQFNQNAFHTAPSMNYYNASYNQQKPFQTQY